MRTCSEVTRLVSSDELAEAGWVGRLATRMHLLLCRHCRRYASQIRSVGSLARSGWAPTEDELEAGRRLEADLLRRIPGGEGGGSPPDPGPEGG